MSLLFRSLMLAAALTALAISLGCEAAPAGHPGVVTATPPDVSGDSDRFSIYALDGEVWLDQAGRERALGSLEGRVQVLAMVYTHCYHTCPQIVADMKWLEAMTEDLEDEVGFVLVSLDPDRDDPERLTRYAEGIGLDPERWTLLMGSEDETRALAALLGVRYRQEADREIAHTNELTVLGMDGEIAHQRKGLDEDLDRTLSALLKAAGR
jgi:protein SCO1